MIHVTFNCLYIATVCVNEKTAVRKEYFSKRRPVYYTNEPSILTAMYTQYHAWGSHPPGYEAKLLAISQTLGIPAYLFAKIAHILGDFCLQIMVISHPAPRGLPKPGLWPDQTLIFTRHKGLLTAASITPHTTTKWKTHCYSTDIAK